MKIYLNLATVGAKLTGLGVYALACARVVSRHYDAITIHNDTYRAPTSRSIESPVGVALGAGFAGALKRLLYLRSVDVPEHSLSYSPTHHGAGSARFSIITIHDLIALRHPKQHFLQWIYFRFQLPKVARRSTAVFTVSETSKADIAEAYGIPRSRIFVVPNQLDKSIFRPSEVNKEPFLLCVGGKFFHKNIHELIENHPIWSPMYTLKVLSCSGKYREYLRELVRSEGLEDKVEIHGFVSREDLIAAYQRCSAFVYPSKWEGFGIPPLEALACGARVIVSDIPVHREVCSDAATYVTLGDRRSWADAFATLEDAAVTQRLTLLASRRIEEFSEGRFELKLLAALETVAAENGIVLDRKRIDTKELRA